MVLSNKKLKQKLRTTRAESFPTTVSGGSHSNFKETSTNPDPKSELQELLEAAKQRPRLSKREKRRKTLSLRGFDGKQKSPNGEDSQENEKIGEKKEMGLVGDDERGENFDEKKKRREKKRKREEEESEEKGLEQDKVVKEAKKAKKKKKKNKKKKKAKNAEEKLSVEPGGVAEAAKVTNESHMNEATRVYVGGIPYYSSEDDIRSYFEGCGTIREVDCMTFPDSGKFRGIAIICFKTEAAAQRALAFNEADMGGFYLKIQPYKTTRSNRVSNFAPKIVEGYNRIYVGNLSWDIMEDDLRKFFSGCNITSMRFGVDKETEGFRGYAHVDFSDNLSLATALKLDQKIVCGRPVKISCAVPKTGAKVKSTAVPTTNETNKTIETNNTELSSSNGKMRRRTCYECGEKGHISSACPKKPTTDPTNSNAS